MKGTLPDKRAAADAKKHCAAEPTRRKQKWGIMMKAEFTAIIEPAPEGGFWAICPEVPGANGQGETIEEAKNNLREAIELILDDRRTDILRGLPDDAIQEKVMIG
jgi:predicted RNase H-like HicB family nuclease